MVFSFITVIVVVVALGAYYLYLNDFNPETLEIVFPVAAAVLAAAYFGTKSIWVDAPAPVVRVVPIAVLHDQSSGKLSGLIQHRAYDSGEDMDRFRALKDLDTYAHYNAFRALDVWARLSQVHSTEDSDAQGPLADLLEFAVLNWLARTENIIGYEPGETTYGLQGFASAGQPARDLNPVAVSGQQGEPNPFLAAFGLRIALPPGGAIHRTRPVHSEAQREVKIRTGHSELAMALLPGAIHPFVDSRDEIGRRIRQNLLLEVKTPHAWIHYFTVRFKFSQRPYSRFAEQAKGERVWFERLLEQFERNFSWERLRLHYDPR